MLFHEKVTLLLRHHGRVLVSNLPLAPFIDVHECESGPGLVSLRIRVQKKVRKDSTRRKSAKEQHGFLCHHTNKRELNRTYSSPHGKLVDSGIHAPVLTLNHVGLQNDSLRLHLQKIRKIRLDAGVVGTGKVGDGRKKDTLGRESLGDGIGIQCSESIVPQKEQLGDLCVRNGRGRAFCARCRKERASPCFNLLEGIKGRSLTGSRKRHLGQRTLIPMIVTVSFST
jgi:hypothetical protein